jgi:selenocysteine lyase/cysteine desulfurase
MLPHMAVDMKADKDPGHIDFLAFSGHKMYAPFGVGVLIGKRKFFNGSAPEYSGGGTVRAVSKKNVVWADAPDREEAGSPNVLGVLALADTIRYIEKTGMKNISAYEQALCNYAFNKLQAIPGLTIYGGYPRIGVISFNLDSVPHALLGDILSREGGIGVRTGCFCAHTYVRTLLGKEKDDAMDINYYKQPGAQLPGMVRISLAAYNKKEEVDLLCGLLRQIAAQTDDYKAAYVYSAGKEKYVSGNNNAVW